MLKLNTQHFVLIILMLSILFTGCKEDQKLLTIWHTESDENAKAVLASLVEEFEENHPKLDVEIVSIGWGDLSDKLTTSLTTGTEPDIVHLQPFMVYSLYEQDLLEPIDDLIKDIGEKDIYPAIKDLQLFDGQRYGIAYAMNTTHFGYRGDWASEKGLSIPTTWNEYLAFVKALHQDLDNDGQIDRYGVVLPGGSSFFMDLLLSELVASNGGRLFDEKGQPTFTEKPVVETLEFIAELSKYAPEDWKNINVSEQYQLWAEGVCANVMVTAARASKQVEADADVTLKPSPDVFSVMEQPVGPSGIKSYATMDCEPWSIFRSSDVKPEAKAFLRSFYSKENYLEFCSQVPIHLTPVLRSVAESSEYLNNPDVKKWSPWMDQSLMMLNEKRVHPVLLTEDDDKEIAFLMKIQGSRILTDMIMAAVNSDNIQEVAEVAQKKAEEFIEFSGFKTSIIGNE